MPLPRDGGEERSQKTYLVSVSDMPAAYHARGTLSSTEGCIGGYIWGVHWGPLPSLDPSFGR
jgi:hypothetical protein